MIKNLLIVLIISAITISAGVAQSKKSVSTKGKSSTVASPNWGIGLRLGDPTGLTVKKYLANSNALEFNIGKSPYWGYDYYDGFYNNNKYKGYDYIGYERGKAISIQGHYLFNKDIPNARGLQWYLGVGPQLRFNRYSYSYRYDAGNAWVYVTDEVTNVDFGVDGVAGLEYKIPNAPLAVFGDVNLLLELFDDPFVAYFQGGFGIRYNF